MDMEHEHRHHEHSPREQMIRENDEKAKHVEQMHEKHHSHHQHRGHDHHAMIEDFRKRFYVVLVLTVPIMLLSQMIQHWLNVHISFSGSQYVLLALSSVVFFYGG